MPLSFAVRRSAAEWRGPKEVNVPPPEGGGFGNGLKALFRPKAGKMFPAPSGLQEVDGLNRLL
jgi:hypothetical protein